MTVELRDTIILPLYWLVSRRTVCPDRLRPWWKCAQMDPMFKIDNYNLIMLARMESVCDLSCDFSHHFPQKKSAAGCQGTRKTQKLAKHVCERQIRG